MSFDTPQSLENPRAMRALAHPVRIRIRELLDSEGPMTATQVSEHIGESPANCSFHLRTLAKYGFIEEAEPTKGRNRPWRNRSGGMLIQPEKLIGGARQAALAASSALRDAIFRRIERWSREQSELPEPWNSIGFESEFVTRMTPEELKEVGRGIGELLKPFQTAREPAPDSRRVTIAVFGFPNPSPDD